MILQKFLMGKSLTSRLYRSFLFKTFFITAFCLTLPCLFAVKLEFDIHPGTFTMNIEKLNSPESKPELSGSQQTTAKGVPDSTITPLPELLKKILETFPHIFIKPQSSGVTSSRPNATVEQVLQPPFSENELNGKGEKELVALRDGNASIEVLLSTRAPANMEVHLYDVDGSEIWFKGLSLLLWRRPDDKTNAPVSFKGNSDPSSMYKNNEGDYSPSENLTYSFDMKEGQKVILKTGGNAEPRSYIKARGSAF